MSRRKNLPAPKGRGPVAPPPNASQPTRLHVLLWRERTRTANVLVALVALVMGHSGVAVLALVASVVDGWGGSHD